MKYTDQPILDTDFQCSHLHHFGKPGRFNQEKPYSQVTRETSNHRRLKQGNLGESITLAQGRWDYKYTNCTYWHLQVKKNVFSSVISSEVGHLIENFADKNNWLNLCHVKNVSTSNFGWVSDRLILKHHELLDFQNVAEHHLLLRVLLATLFT